MGSLWFPSIHAGNCLALPSDVRPTSIRSPPIVFRVPATVLRCCPRSVRGPPIVFRQLPRIVRPRWVLAKLRNIFLGFPGFPSKFLGFPTGFPRMLSWFPGFPHVRLGGFRHSIGLRAKFPADPFGLPWDLLGFLAPMPATVLPCCPMSVRHPSDIHPTSIRGPPIVFRHLPRIARPRVSVWCIGFESADQTHNSIGLRACHFTANGSSHQRPRNARTNTFSVKGWYFKLKKIKLKFVFASKFKGKDF